MGSELGAALVVSLVGGGLVAGIAQLVTALVNRGKAPSERDKVETERDSIIVSSAERVVGILRGEIDLATQSQAEAHAEIARLQLLLTAARQDLDAAHSEIRQLKARVAELERT
jgi:predicted  nucleic acid-binding Zn-ribbon protein